MASTDLYLIRHGLAGEATAATDDSRRPLTPAGRKRTRAVAKRLRTVGVHVQLLLSSPLVRARQTAELLQEEGLCEELKESALLAPGGDFEQWLAWLGRWRRQGSECLGLVGHMPALGAWAERLVWGRPNQSIVFKKAGIVGLTLPSRGSPVGRSLLFLLAAPRDLL